VYFKDSVNLVSYFLEFQKLFFGLFDLVGCAWLSWFGFFWGFPILQIDAEVDNDKNHKDD